MRRSDSVTDDSSVIGTNDDATYAKLACVKAGYYKDEYLQAFCGSVTSEAIHREPEIKQGYWARVQIVENVVRQFCEKSKGECQILSLGAGFDTLYWRLMAEKSVKLRKYVEIDFSSVTAKKISHIMRPSGKKLKEVLDRNSQSLTAADKSHTDLHADPYHLVGADVRQMKELKQKIDSADVDYSLPTLVIAECVLVYMTKEASGELLANIAQTFEQVAILDYDQINTSDTFSEVMRENLRARQINLVGADACHDATAQIERFKSAGYDHLVVKSMQDIWETTLNTPERKRITELEFLDEPHLREQLFNHYCIVYAAKGAQESPTRQIMI